MKMENVLTDCITVTEQGNVTNNVSKDKEDGNMKYNELSTKMNEIYKDRMFRIEEPYEIIEYFETVEMIVDAYRDQEGLDVLDSIEDAENAYDSLSFDFEFEKTFEEIVEECDGDLSIIGEVISGLLLDVLCDAPEWYLREYISNLDLLEELADYGYIEFERENTTLEEAFTEFCAFHHCHMQDRSVIQIKRYLMLFNCFTEDLKDTLIKEISEDDISEFMHNSLLERKMEHIKVEQFISFLRQLFEYAVEYDLCEYNPMDFIDCENMKSA